MNATSNIITAMHNVSPQSHDYPRVFWALAGPRQMASSRLHGYLVHEYLSVQGWRSHLVQAPRVRTDDTLPETLALIRTADVNPDDIYVFQKLYGPRTLHAMSILANRGAKVVLVDCDYPIKQDVAALSDLILCPSKYLADLYRTCGFVNTKEVQEMYESYRMPKSDGERAVLVCMWFGCHEPVRVDELDWLRSLIARRFPSYCLRTISNHPSATHPWDLITSWDLIAASDIVIITGNDSIATSCKSPNRAIQAMALGVPVVAFPIPSYRTIIRHGHNGYLCRSAREWSEALQELSNAQHRHNMARLCYRYATRYFSTNCVGARWIELLTNIGGT